MENILKNRKIERLYHFTQAENLNSIFINGLLPRDTLKNRNIFSKINDYNRYDKCENAVCISIGFPNYKMFYSLRKSQTDTEWAVLELDARILLDLKCAFCWTNAGSEESYSIPIKDRMTVSAFEELFENKEGYPSRELLNIPDYYPTNPQAEVLVFSSIPVKYVKAVYLSSSSTFATLNKYSCFKPNHIKLSQNDSYFRYRIDWEYWKREV